MFSPDDKLLVLCTDDRSLRVIELPDGNGRTLSSQKLIYGYTFSPAGELLVVDEQGLARYNPRTGELLARHANHRFGTVLGSMHSLWVSNDDKDILFLEASSRRKRYYQSKYEGPLARATITNTRTYMYEFSYKFMLLQNYKESTAKFVGDIPQLLMNQTGAIIGWGGS